MTSALLFVANHLWQSTVFVACAYLVTLPLAHNRASVRHWIWLAASAKFLVPFALMIHLGSQLEWRTMATVTPGMTVAIQSVSEPFTSSMSWIRPGGPSAGSDSVVTPGSVGILLLAVVWILGTVSLLTRWLFGWRRVSNILREGSVVKRGREFELLRLLERRWGLKRSIALVSSNSSFEPGIFGTWKPVLLWAQGIGQRLDDAQAEAILAHEVAHVRRHDNLTSAIHMIVEALFWFHPFVWWVGARLVHERERACDEDVIRLGSDPEVYAESILKTCEFYVESPLPCVASVTGSDLKKRIEAIMRQVSPLRLSAGRRLLLGMAGIMVVAGPVIIGLANTPYLQVPQLTIPATLPAFETASVKLNKSADDTTRMGFAPGGRFIATNATLKMLFLTAYGTPGPLPDFRMAGGPDWIDFDRFDIEAKAEGDPAPVQVLLMLRSLLAERFKLTVHPESRELPIYALVLASSDGRIGPQLRPSNVDCPAEGTRPPATPPRPGTPPVCGTRGGPGRITGGAVTLAQLANALSPRVDRVVVDKTTLTGRFDVDLAWTAGQPPPSGGPAGGLPPPTAVGGSIFSALDEQLGLKLQSARGPVEVLVIDHAEKPSEN